ncbi:hypothetical protein BMS_2307 [Halobacteriovorax marinus SJ]|uniref:Lipoprotein n=1 Tax=Halobacteriovorax marinus (strain ATCC BAA-682 / DSM 15412 / SJ) TaxID=862908 RepID=E1X4D5_HALMS|nr:hypothetical protein [Halobacteriovorax marinus]CBW27107.1 hypothetical protein BMS_2307 [Halobacteriovorax marinus SJ]
MSKYFFLVLIFIFQSCNSLDGELHNFRDYSLLNSKGESITLLEGANPATLELNSSRLFTLNLDQHTFNFTIPKDVKLPRENGELSLTAHQTSQDYGVYARLVTHIIRGEELVGRETCSWIERYHHCDEQGNCRVLYRSREGIKDVIFYDEIHQKNVVLNLRFDDTHESIAQFSGVKKIVKKVYRYESTCY